MYYWFQVMVAHSNEQGSGREGKEEERLLRLFVVVGKEVTAEQLMEHFYTFGTVQYVNLAYVKFYRMVRLLPPFAPPLPPPSSSGLPV